MKEFKDYKNSFEIIKDIKEAIDESDVVESYNGEQNIVTLDLTPLSSASNTGSGCGIPGCFGTFEKVS